ncbi:LRR receptor-like kinase family [Chlorella sorokiniana]|uniref:LRR receptor-like kinase family n=1 Tax=Chlorella sorokiniana TaxID=3076 RepID=A0A2P6TFD6_CHLSO|nr:LRR receptor-like kinase family [Chlorella sorokiniana]|eukprot:PRW32686.1 LRR receptor-like kinase family [Chlorella sorokiniana]
MSTGSTLCVASWCAALRQLTSLDLSTGFVGTLRLSSNLSGLTALKRLLLEGERVVVDAAARLPPNVERLRLGDSRSVALPTQLSALTRLSLLVLRARSCTPDGFAVLTRLGQLAKLVLQYNSYLPACLPQLTGLEGLCLEEASDIMQPEAAHGAIEDALGHLTQLTSLCILEEPDRCPPPAAVAGLSRLQRCCLGSADYAGNPEMPPIALPPGPWAASLRELGASLDVLQHSAGTLAAATQLTRLAITGGSFKGHQQAAFWEWARIHPLLRKLQIEFLHEAELPGAAVHAICSLSRQRPALDVVTLLAEDGGTFEKEFDIAI